MGFQNPYDDATNRVGLIALAVVVLVLIGIGVVLGKFVF